MPVKISIIKQTNNQTFKNDYQKLYHIYVKEQNNLVYEVYGRK